MGPSVELLWWEGCPSLERALDELRGAMREVGLDPEAVHLREVTTDEDARREGFLGSPTILIDGADAFPAEAGATVGLNCRVYRRAGGRVSPTPDPADLRRALEQALAA